MRLFIATLLISMLALATATMAGRHDSFSVLGDKIMTIDDVVIDVDGDKVIITNDYEDGEIEINEDYEFYLDGDRIELNASQKAEVKEFYDQTIEVRKEALEIAKEGAKIGIQGAKIGLKAVGGVIKMIFTDYDEDDLDRDMDRESQKIEERAQLLEERADDIEDMAKDLEDLLYELEEDIPAFHDLDWY